MRKRINTIMIAVVAALLATTACQKEQDMDLKSRESVKISIRSSIDDYVPAGAKATIEQVARVKWTDGDKVYAYDATGELGELTVSLNDDARYAYLSGTIAAPAGNTITLVYAAGCTHDELAGGKLTFDLSVQNGQIAFVLYATLSYEDGAMEITDVFVPFHFATSAMKVHCTGLGTTGSISSATVSGVNNTCQLTLKSNGNPTVAGINNGTITRTGTGAFEASNDGRAAFTIALVASEESSARIISVSKNAKVYQSAFDATKIETGSLYTSVYSFTEATE